MSLFRSLSCYFDSCKPVHCHLIGMQASIVAIESTDYCRSSKILKITDSVLISEWMPQPHFSKIVFSRTCPRPMVLYSSFDKVHKLHSCNRQIY
jgi:hypothetical protein